MKRGIVHKVLKGILYTFLLLVAALAVHVYIVTRPKAPDAHTRMMARIDIKQHIDSGDSTRITEWLYKQKGIDHVLCNPQSSIVVFTFFPVQTTGDRIIKDFQANLPYRAERFVPTEAQMQGGCPVASTSFTYKVYHFFHSLF